MESYVIDKILIGHVKPVTAVAWSPNGRFLLSSSYDCTVLLWNVITGEILYEIHTDSPVVSAEFCPRKDKNIFIFNTSMDVYFINLSINYLINCVATKKLFLKK